MIKLIVGHKGSGKTKTMIAMANEAVNTSKGNVVCVEKGSQLLYDLNHQVRLVDVDQYGIKNCDSYFGFLCV
jgi:Tfp pilus assembly ATPase PilU